MSFKSIAEFLDPQNGHSPTTAERDLIAKTQAGECCRLWQGKQPIRPTGPGDRTSIRAPLLRLLILGGTKECGLHERGVWLEGGWVDGELDLSYCSGKGATVLDYCHFTDCPDLSRTTLPQLSFDDSALPGLYAQGSRISGTLFLRRVIATGTVNVSVAKIGGQLSCGGATLDGGKDGHGTALAALNAQGVEVGQDLFLSQVTATGTVAVNGAKIGGQLDFEGTTLDGGKGGHGNVLKALNAQRLQVTQSLLFRDLTKVQGRIDLTAAYVGDLVDDAESWPDDLDSLILDGFTYDRIAGGGPITFAVRRRWLATGSHWYGDFRPQPYTQLARTLRQMGHAGEARQVLMERERLLAAHRLASDHAEYQLALSGEQMQSGDAGWIWLRTRGAQLWSGLTRRVAGYGYAPQYALYWSLACVGVSFLAYFFFWRFGAMVPTDAMILTSAEWKAAYGANPLAPALVWAAGSGPATSHYETFYSAAYALDVFLPIVDLGQQSTWGQTTVTWAGWSARLYTWVLQAAGYTITTLGLAAATGIIQRNQPD